MGAEMIGVGEQLPIGAIGSQALEVFDLQWLIGGPGRGSYAKRDSQINEFHLQLLF
jgi:hypothetical protein